MSSLYTLKEVADNVGALRSGGHRYSSDRKLTTAKLKN